MFRLPQQDATDEKARKHEEHVDTDPQLAKEPAHAGAAFSRSVLPPRNNDPRGGVEEDDQQHRRARIPSSGKP
jgi:hypothetical protein